MSTHATYVGGPLDGRRALVETRTGSEHVVPLYDRAYRRKVARLIYKHAPKGTLTFQRRQTRRRV